MHYLLACNAGEVMFMFVAAAAGWPAPLAAIQILWLNLITDALLHIVAVTLPYAQPVFAVRTDPGRDWLLVVCLSLVPVTTVESVKWLRGRAGPAHPLGLRSSPERGDG
jgi:Ca2+-transporting ATPase